MEDKELKHVGTLGMRWGVRRNKYLAKVHEGDAKFLKKVGLKGASNAISKMAAGRRAKAAMWKKKLNSRNKEQYNEAKKYIDQEKSIMRQQLKTKMMEARNSKKAAIIKKNWTQMMKDEGWDKSSSSLAKSSQVGRQKVEDFLLSLVDPRMPKA